MRISDWSSDVCSSDLTKVALAQARATIDGDFGVVSPLGTDPIAFAVGGEYREYAASQASDTLAAGGDLGVAGGAAPNIDGGLSVYETIGDIIIPPVQDRPFLEDLTLAGGIRNLDYKVNHTGHTAIPSPPYQDRASYH